MRLGVLIALSMFLSGIDGAARAGDATAPGASCADADKPAGVQQAVNSAIYTCTTTGATRNWYPQPLYIGSTSTGCSTTTEGMLRYNATTRLTEYCDGGTWTQASQTQSAGGPDAPAGSAYFVLTNTTYTGNLGGLAGADSACLTEIGTTNTSWRGYSVANSRGMINSTYVKAFLCDQDVCNRTKPSTSYNFAYANSATPGGASFTTDNGGLGPNDSYLWSAANYFGGAYEYWTNISSTSATQWATLPAGNIYASYHHCSNWTDGSSGQSGLLGSSPQSDGGRWAAANGYCDTPRRLICLVNPVCSGAALPAFTDVTNQVTGTQVTSNIVQVTGSICGSLAVSITGTGSPEYQVCADSSCSSVVHAWTSTAGFIAPNQYIRVRQTTSASASTAITATLNVETLSTTWTATTGACNPSAFSFTDLTAQTPVTQVTSNIIQITNTICGTLAISIAGAGTPQYQTCSNASCSSVVQNWTATAGTIANNGYVRIRQTTATPASTAQTATLTIESGSTTWTATTQDYKLIFVTSTTYNGNRGGLSGADTSCATQASAQSLPGTYKAWLATTASNDPQTLMTQATVPYRVPNTNRNIVASNWTDLVDGTLTRAINVTESGGSASNTNNVWSNADSTGTVVGANNCTNWTSSSSGVNGAVGSSNATNTSWANNSTAACNTSKRLYCVQQ